MAIAVSGAAVLLAAAARIERINSETVNFLQAQRNIARLVKEGADRHVWTVDSAVEGLPEPELGLLGRAWDGLYMGLNPGWKPAHKLHSESAAEYLKSVFLQKMPIRNVMNFYEGKDRIVVHMNGLYLSFRAKREQPLTEKKRWLFFEPEYPGESRASRIVEATMVRTHSSRLTYDGHANDCKTQDLMPLTLERFVGITGNVRDIDYLVKII